MSNRYFRSHDDAEKSIVRQLKVLVVVLILSNVVLGVCGFYFLRAIDQKYSKLVGQAVPTMNDLQTLTAFSMEAMRATAPILFAESPQNRRAVAQRARVALGRDRDLRNLILKRDELSTDTRERVELQNAGEGFTKSATELIGLFESGRTAEAVQLREQSLRPVFDRYVAATTNIADLLEAQSLRTSDTLTANTGNVSKFILGVASWPVMIFGAFLLITVIFIIAVLLNVFVFKRATL
jgi:Four helix bundle sensory module for signal transduction